MAAHFKEWSEKPENLVLQEKEKGRGSYGRVHIGKLAGNPVAVKVIHPELLRAHENDRLLLGFKEECAKLQSLKHDRIVRLLGTFWDKNLGPLLVMEVLDQNLEEFLRDHSKPGSLPLMQQLEIVKEVTEGLRYLHSHNMVHRDLKPANILIGKDGHLRIGDLGQSKLLNSLSDIMKTTQPGTPLYLPPEALKRGGAYTLKIDVFSLGVVTLCIATQAAPTTDILNIGAVPEIIRRKEDLDRLEEKHPLKGVISACLQDDPNLRPDMCFIDDHLGALVGNGRLDSTVNKLEEALTDQRKELMALKKLYDLQKKELADSNSKFEAQESRCQSHVQTIGRQAKELNAQKLALDEEQKAKKRQGEEMLQRASKLIAKLKACEDKCQRHICIIERQTRVLSAQEKSLNEEREAKQLQQKVMLERIVNLETKLKMKHVEYEKGVVCIEETLANQRQELDELSKWSTNAFDRNTVLEREVRDLRKRLTTAKSELEAEVMEHATKIQELLDNDHEREPLRQKAVTDEEVSFDRRSLFKSKATLKDDEVNCGRSSLFLVKDGRKYSIPDYQGYFRRRGFGVEVVGISKPTNESSKDVIVEVETRSKEEVDMPHELKSQTSLMINETTTATLTGPYLPEIMKVISFFMDNDPFLMGCGLHVVDSTTKMTTEIDNVEDEQEEGSVKVSGPIRLVMYLRKLIHQTLVWYITVMDSPQERSIFEIAAIVTDKSDVLDGASDLESASKLHVEGEGSHHSGILFHRKSNIGTSVDDPPHGISVAVQTDTTTSEAAILTGKKTFKGNKSEAIPDDKSKQRFIRPLAHTLNLEPAVIKLMDRCQMIDKQSLRIHSDFTRVDSIEGAEHKLEEFSASYWDLFKRQRIIRECFRVRETLPHNILALLVSTLEAQFPQTLFYPDVDNNTVHFLSLDQSICRAVDTAIQDFLSKRKGTQRQPPRTKRQPTMITLPMPYNRSLTVKKGDLVKEEVTAIVNAANGWLKHVGGVAQAINQASRGQVQRESDQVIRVNRQRPIPTGQVAVTGAGGDLRCKVVIHAVGPDACVMKMDDFKQLLKQACENTLHCADDQGMHSIALPPISTGIYAMPKDLVAQILIDTILQYPYRQDSSLKDIRIVIIDQQTFMPFLQYAQQVPDSSTTH